jgi:type IV pilus assembly protein PilY1
MRAISETPHRYKEAVMNACSANPRRMNAPSAVPRDASSMRRLSRAALCAFLVAVAPTGHGAPLSLTDSPLFVTTPANPNVMLLIDNSGSMNNIIWATSYNNATTYPHWGGTDWSASNGNVQLANVNRGSCASGWKEGNNGGTTKCLKLPDPAPSLPNVGATRYAGNYLNYLFQTYADGTDLTIGTIPNDYRMNVARNVATTLVNNTSGVRFGVSRFNLDQGGRVDAACGSSASTVTTAIGGYTASTWTPLAEAYYEVTRYFRGLSSYYNTGVTYTSPLQYRCQKNFTIVITDGFPTYDTNFPTNDPDDVANTSFALPNWDALAPTTSSRDYPNFPQYSDGFQPTGTSAEEGFSLYLDDLAKFGYDVDMKTSGTDDAGGSWQDPNFTKQNITTYTVGFAVANQMLQDAASYGGGIYYTATNAAQLSSALSNAIADVGSKSASAAAVAVNSRSLSTNSRLYQALLTSSSWSGDLIAYPIDTNGNVGSTPVWRAKDRLIAQDWNTGRAILTRNATQGIPFRWVTSGANTLTANTQTVLNKNPATGSTDSQGQARLEYLRGSNANEGTGNDYRVRSGNFKLGDIANSSPLYVGAPVYLPNIETAAHSDFRANYVGRQEMVYVGANDGMLHGFSAATGDEKIAYVPSFLFDDAVTPANPNTTNGPHQLTNKNYSHRFYVDAPPTAGDAYGNFAHGCATTACWRTVLVGGVGRGGKGYFALDITDPTGAKTATAGLAFSEGNAANIALWEFTDSTSGDMGFTYGQATIARVRTSATTTAWAAIFGNGYNSANERAVLYVVNVVTGAQIAKIVLPDPVLDPNYPSGENPLIGNGLSAPAVVDKDGDYIQDYAYAGDLKGNLWKIDLTNNNPSSWGSFYKQGSKPVPLYTATDGTNRLPLTGRPEVGTHPAGQSGFMVYFGSGRYLASGDNDPNATPVLANAFHGVWDRDTEQSASVSDQGAAVLKTRLLTQTIGTATVASQTVRQVTNNALNNWGDTGTACNPSSAGNNCMGWIVNLPTTGERSVSNPVLLGGTTPRIIYTTLIPDNAACAYGGSSWLMEHNPANGGPPSAGVFDLDGSNTITSADLIGGVTPVAGINPGIGIMPEPVILRDPSRNRDLKLVPGSTGVVRSIANYPGTGSGGRMSWRQLK